MAEEKIMVDRRSSPWKKYAMYGLIAFAVIAAAILLIFLFIRHDDFSAVKGRVVKALAPATVGAVMAYLMNPLMSFIEIRFKWLFYKRSKKISRANKAARFLSIAITVIIVIFVIANLFNLLIPQLVSTITGIINDAGGQADRIEKWYRGLELENTFAGEYIEMGFAKATEYVQDFIQNRLADTVTNMLRPLANGVLSFFGTVYNLIVGLVFAIYIMGYKEKLSAISKKMVYATFKRKRANAIVRITRACHIKFTSAITGTLVDSLIIGLLCFMAMTVFDVPYPPLVSVIVGVTNVIPFFGPFIGAIPSAILILFASPIKCLHFIIIIVIIQQLDGNLIKPKILGNTLGLSPFWVLFACTFFGSLWGVAGMLIGAPLMACIYMIVKELIENRLYRRGLMTETDDYMDLDRVDETEMFRMMVEGGENAEGTSPSESQEPVDEKKEENTQPEKKSASGREKRRSAEKEKSENSGGEAEKEAESAGAETSQGKKAVVGPRQGRPAEYVPASVRELNRAAGRQKYSIDSDFEDESEDDGEIYQAIRGEKEKKDGAVKGGTKAKRRSVIDLVKGMIKRK